MTKCLRLVAFCAITIGAFSVGFLVGAVRYPFCALGWIDEVRS